METRLTLSPDQSCQSMSHITQEQRYTISCMLEKGFRITEIARTIDKHKSVVSREIKRNCDQRSGQYKSDLAHRKYQKRMIEKPKKISFTEEIKFRIEDLIRQDYSPEQVEGFLKKNHQQTVSKERIYQHIWRDKKRKGNLHEHLRRKGRKYRKRGASKDSRGIIKGRIGIENRPEVVNERGRFGDLEIDLVMGANHKGALLTINDRASGVLKIGKVESKSADEICRVACELLSDWKPHIKTITADNGKEFAQHQKISKILSIDFFFANPYHSWERGSNENANGLIRQYFTKKMDFKSITEEQIKAVELKLNSRPRKRFKYETPMFVMESLLFNPKVAFVA
jgi:IS30 family transposase